MKHVWFSSLFAALVLLLLPGCSEPIGANAEPETTSSATLQAAGEAAKRSEAAGQQEATIVDIAVAVNNDTGEFSVLIEALTRTGLVSVLQGKGQFTVFAPTDAAFVDLLAELGAASLDDIDDATLTSVLLYHLAPGRRFSGTVLSQKRIKTLNGGFLFVDSGAAALIDANDRQSNILVGAGLFDIAASNGVIHVIDRVLLP